MPEVARSAMPKFVGVYDPSFANFRECVSPIVFYIAPACEPYSVSLSVQAQQCFVVSSHCALGSGPTLLECVST